MLILAAVGIALWMYCLPQRAAKQHPGVGVEGFQIFLTNEYSSVFWLFENEKTHHKIPLVSLPCALLHALFVLTRFAALEAFSSASCPRCEPLPGGEVSSLTHCFWRVKWSAGASWRHPPTLAVCSSHGLWKSSATNRPPNSPDWILHISLTLENHLGYI